MMSLFVGAGESPAASQVVTYNGGPGHTGYFDSQPLYRLKGLKWKYDTGASMVTSPLLPYRGCLYFGDSDGWFHAVDLQSGEEKWRFNAGKTVAGSPTIYHDRAYWGCGAGVLYVLDPNTGKELGRFETKGRTEGRDGSICFPPLIHDGVVYFTSHDSCLYALDAESLECKFTFRTEGSMCCSPSLCGNVIFFSNASGYVYALDLDKQAVKWRFKAGKNVYHSPAIAEGTAYFCSNDRFAYALDASTGKEIWRFEADGIISKEPAIHDGIAYFNTLHSHLYALDAKSGQMKWDVKTEGKAYSKTIVVRDVVFFGSGDRHLYAVSASSGKVLWKFRAADMVNYPSCHDGAVFFGSGGSVYALE
jgi:outer membrane protein assembly factor BamB